jgi:hypothetical protein
MKKVVVVLAVFILAASGAFAIDMMSYPPPVEGGDLMVDVGIGYASALGYSGSGTTMKIPPIFAQVEYALPVGVPISVGGMVSFWQYGWEYYSYSYTWTYVVGGARANWHWGLDVDWLDFYTGLLIGYRYFKENYDGPKGYWYTEANYGGFTVGAQAGAHFYFTKNVGAVLEAGYPFLIKAGLALKF